MCLNQLKEKNKKNLKPCNVLQLLISKLATVMGEPCIFIMDHWIIKDIYLLASVMGSTLYVYHGLLDNTGHLLIGLNFIWIMDPGDIISHLMDAAGAWD